MNQAVMRRLVIVVVIGGMSIIGACKRQAPPVANPEAVVQQARQAGMEGNFDKGLLELENAVQNPDYERNRPQLLGELLRYNLTMTGRVEAAEAAFQRVWRSDPEAAAPSIGIIERYLYDQQQYDELAAWSARLASEARLPAECLAAVAEWHCKALHASGQSLESPLGGYLARLPVPLGCKLLRGAIGQAGVSSAATDRMLSAGEKAYGKAALWQATAAALRLDARLKDAAPGEVVAFVKNTVPTLAKNDAAMLVARASRALLGKKQADAADALCAWAVEQAAARPELRDAAADVWIEAAGLQPSPCQVTLNRLQSLKKGGIEDEHLVSLVSSSVPRALQADDKDAMRTLLAMAVAFHFTTNQLLPKAEADSAILDLSFCTEEYDTALQLLDRGVCGQDAAWHALMRAKVRAHQALKAGRTDDAVAGFREFMVGIEQQGEDQIDPVSQMRYTKEMVLGLNAQRIGDILGKAGRVKEAGDAYLQARAWFAKASAGVARDSKESRWIAGETARLPGKL